MPTHAEAKVQSEVARSALERMIIFNELDSTAMYSEKQLAGILGLGRTPVREALLKLSLDKMAVVHPRRGVQFPPVTVEQQLKLLEVRRGMEPMCVRFAAMRGTVDQKRTMLQLGDAIVEAAEKGDEVAVLDRLREIHDILAEATKNDYFPRVMGPLQGMSRRFWFVNKKPGDMPKGSALHRDVMLAVARGDEGEAVAASERLLDYLTEFTYNTLKLGG